MRSYLLFLGCIQVTLWHIVVFLLSCSSPALAQPLRELGLRYNQPSTIVGSVLLPDGSQIVGGYLVASQEVAILTKIDFSGAVTWSRTITSPGNGSTIQSVSIAADGSILATGAVLVGRTYQPILFSFTANGSLQWHKHFYADSIVQLHSHIRTRDGSIVMVGAIDLPLSNGGAYSIGYILKTDSAGNPLWSYKVAGALPSYSTQYLQILECKDSNLLLIGFEDYKLTDTSVRTNDLLLTLLSPKGDIIKHVSYNCPTNPLVGKSIIQGSDGSFTGGGEMFIPGFGSKAMVFHCTAIDQIEWANSYDIFKIESVKQLLERHDGKTIALNLGNGGFPSPPHLLVISTSGTLESAMEINDRLVNYGALNRYPAADSLLTVTTNDIANNTRNIDIITTNEVLSSCAFTPQLGSSAAIVMNKVATGIHFMPFAPTTDSMLFHFAIASAPTTSTVLCINDDEVEHSLPTSSQRLYPNPIHLGSSGFITPSTTLIDSYDLILRDLTGREVYRTHRETSTSGEQIQIPTVGLASGVYTVELLDANSFAKVWRGKVVVE